jgi:hypothetical protein
MARMVTIASIISRARVMADMRNSDFINAEEALAMFNDVYCELFDELVGSYENYFTAEQEFTIQSGTNTYALPSDFYKVIGVDFKVSNDAYITLRPYMEAERNMTLTTNLTVPNGTVKIRYVPAPAIFTDVSQEIDSVAGWDRLLSLLMAIDMGDSEETDTRALRDKYARTLQRVRDMAAPRDAGMPARMTDVNKPNLQWIYGALQYRLYGGEIRLINTEYIGSDLYPSFI